MSGPSIIYTPGRVELHGTVETREEADMLVNIAIKARQMIIADLDAKMMRTGTPNTEPTK